MTAGAIHFGGGTPNMLSTAEVDVIFDRLGKVFDLAPNADIAIEMDPAILTRDWVGAAARGMNRASLGVQNLTPEVQAAVNRRDTFEHIADYVTWLRETRVTSINLDLMYGLPHQTTANTLSTLDQLLPLRPERLALSKVEVSVEPGDGGLAVTARVKTTGPTGVEMEALTAVSVACLTIYGMLKADFDSLARESKNAGPPWQVVFAAALSGRDGSPPAKAEIDAALKTMVEAVRVGGVGQYAAFGPSGDPLHFH